MTLGKEPVPGMLRLGSPPLKRADGGGPPAQVNAALPGAGPGKEPGAAMAAGLALPGAAPYDLRQMITGNGRASWPPPHR